MVTLIRINYTDGTQVKDYVCEAADTKPTDCGNGSSCYEIDTDKSYVFNARTSTWTQKGANKYLASIAIATAPTKVVYTDGETFDPDGAVVNATYSDGTSAAVTSSIVWTDVVHIGDTTATATYTENGVVRTATQAITVNEAEAE